MFAEASDAVYITTAVLTFLGTTMSGIMAYLMARLNQKASEAAIHVKKVAEKAEIVASRVEIVASKAEIVASKVEEVKSVLAANVLHPETKDPK